MVDSESPQQQRVENDDYGAMMSRMLAAYGRRVAAADPYDLAMLAEAERDARVALAVAVDGLRRRGYSWQDIGDGVGMTRQAAQQKWGH